MLDGRGDSEVDTMSQKSITEELAKHDTAIEDTNKEIDTAQTDIKNLNDEMDEVQDRLAYIPKESFLSSEPACDYHTEDNQDELTVSRAIKDRFGRIIDEHYVTRETVKDYTQEVVDGSKLEIQPGSVQPEDLSPAVQQMIESAAAQPGHITNLPDEEDLTVTEHNTLQFKDRDYNPYNYSGMGKVYLRKHIVNGTNMLTQHMMRKPNTIYVIRYDYCLGGETIEVPEGCVLEFDGGSLRNGSIIGDFILEGNYEYTLSLLKNIIGTVCIKVSKLIDLYGTSYLPNTCFIEVSKGVFGLSDDNLLYKVVREKSNTSLNLGKYQVEPILRNEHASLNYWGGVSDSYNPIFIKEFFDEDTFKCFYNLDSTTEYTIEDTIDTIAFYKALNTKNISLHKGRYHVSKTIKLPDTYVSIIGESYQDTFILNTADIPIFEIKTRTVIRNVSILNYLYNEDISNGKPESLSSSTAIIGKASVYCEFDSIVIRSFNIGIDMGSSSWITRVFNCRFYYCNTGLSANGEFNNSLIKDCDFDYCGIALYLGQGRGIIISDTRAENCGKGIVVTNNFAGEVRGSYFEGNQTSDIEIQWGIKPVSLIDIHNNFFFDSSRNPNKEAFIVYHGSNDSNIFIRNNHFEQYGVPEGKLIYVSKASIYSTNKYVSVASNYYSDRIIPIQDNLLEYNYENYYSYTSNWFFIDVISDLDLTSYLEMGIYNIRMYVHSGKNITITLPNTVDSFKDRIPKFIRISYITESNENIYISGVGTFFGNTGGVNRIIEIQPWLVSNNLSYRKTNYCPSFISVDTNNGKREYSDASLYLVSNLRTFCRSYSGYLVRDDGRQALALSGTTEERPELVGSTSYPVNIGYSYFDTTLGKPIFFNGYAWVDATGSQV